MAAFSSAEMAYLLKIDVSPMGNSKSREVGETFLAAFKSANPDIEIRLKDLSVNPVPHLDGEALSAAYVPEEKRSDAAE
ncbi:hypothetical protein B484DRAFT_391484 [Ochromonadaceae sp. CCMP2298]|nr:hypothetical protein B484DRAFT_391484 [Ochromonadaceae sp. CCMP2298]